MCIKICILRYFLKLDGDHRTTKERKKRKEEKTEMVLRDWLNHYRSTQGNTIWLLKRRIISICSNMDRSPKYTLKEKKYGRIPFVCEYVYTCVCVKCMCIYLVVCKRRGHIVNSIFSRRLRKVPIFTYILHLLSFWVLGIYYP